MSDRVKVAVIGTGWWATTTHIPALLADPHVELTALCDRNAERAAAAASAFGLSRLYTDHITLLKAERPDAVIIATSHAAHFRIARDCLQAGSHTLVEKPLTLKACEARMLMEMAQQQGCALLCGYPWNYTTHAQCARNWVTSGSIGTIQFVNCVFNSYCADLLGGDDRTSGRNYAVHGPGDVYSNKELSGGGHGHLQMTHAAGLLFYITGLQVRTVRSRMANHALAVDLVDAILAEFEEGGLGLIGGTSNAFLPRMELQVYGAEGSLLLDMHAGTASLRQAEGSREEIRSDGDTYPRSAPTAHLIAMARGLEPPVTTLEGWRAVELLEAAYRSAESEGCSITVEELYPSEAPFL
jgi:predicted dehydrogenase